MSDQAKYHSDNQLFRLFCNEDREVIKNIYLDFYPLIERMVSMNSGVVQDAEDVFQEGLVVLIDYCHDPDFQLNVKLKSFFYAVARKIWLKKLRKRGKLGVTFVDVWEYIDLKHATSKQEEEKLKSEQLRLIFKYLTLLPEHEQKTLRLYYIDEKSHKEIAKIMGFADERSARVQKFKYEQKLKKLVREDPDFE